MIITSSGEPGGEPVCPPGATVMAAVDVEWSKNYRIPNGNIPFCYSVVWLAVPVSGAPASLDGASFAYLSVYVENAAETQDLISSADGTLARVLDLAGLVAGHQLCSDLAVLDPRLQPPAARRTRDARGLAAAAASRTNAAIGH